MAEITDRESLELWLEDKPREWATVIAVRAALRVTPLLATALGPRGGARKAARDIILPVLRGTAAPWVAATWPTRGAEAQ
ncbi:MAG: hypothetical protein K8H87_17595, partial [Pseudorhodoplanes sp.]|nr:hypothetical protein [Pseudorhodoplanes sp.]